MPIYETPVIADEARPEGLVVEMVDYTDGIRVHIKGHSEPFKGMPTEGAVNAIAVIKKLLKLQPIEAMWAAIQPHVLKTAFQQPVTRELCKMFPSRLGITVAHVFEYDSAYRLF